MIKCFVCLPTFLSIHLLLGIKGRSFFGHLMLSLSKGDILGKTCSMCLGREKMGNGTGSCGDRAACGTFAFVSKGSFQFLPVHSPRDGKISRGYLKAIPPVLEIKVRHRYLRVYFRIRRTRSASERPSSHLSWNDQIWYLAWSTLPWETES